MAEKALTRKAPFGTALAKAAAVIQNPGEPVPVTFPNSAAIGNNLVFDSFTQEDAIELGHFIYARLLPFAPERSALISISLANSSQVIFQMVTGPGVNPDNERWVRRKRNVVLRFGQSTWFMNQKFEGNEARFAEKNAISSDGMADYAIHGGAVPIRVKGVQGIVAVVIVSGLKQEEDHGVIVEVIQENWH